MSQSVESLKKKVAELEKLLLEKNNEIAQLKLVLSTTNTRLEKLIMQASDEVKWAQKIQKVMSPTEIPSLPGFEVSSKFVPSFKSGGDYFDIFEYQDPMKFGVILSSSSGYSMSALFLSVFLRLSAQLQAKQGLLPYEFILKIAKELMPQMKSDQNVSIFCAQVDRRTLELTFYSIGSVVFFLQKHDRQEIDLIANQVSTLHVVENDSKQNGKLLLAAKDRIIICTEGVIGAKNTEGQVWGEKNLREAIRSTARLGVHEARNEILYRAQMYSGGKQEPDRDQTVLVFEVKDRVIKLA